MYLLLKHGGFSIVILVFAGRKCMFSIFFAKQQDMFKPRKLGVEDDAHRIFRRFFKQVVKNTGKVVFFWDASKIDLNIVKLLIFSLFPESPSRPLKDYFPKEFKNHPKLGLLLF